MKTTIKKVANFNDEDFKKSCYFIVFPSYISLNVRNTDRDRG